jgi:signal transduction histidine kinase
VVSWRNKNKYAALYTLAWTGYLLGGLVTMARDLGILGFNFFTTHAVEYGSALEVSLLAIALSARYNDFRKEKETAIKRSLEIQREATETLEQKVDERTAALNETLDDLKQTQGQLVLAEKMASLGQLTAGVAHEINNPINFVSANIDPLKLNIDDLIQTLEKNPELITEDLKYTIQESRQLLNVMEDGTRRTAEIVKGLRNFSRMDESDQKDMQINECIESTLLMMHSLINENQVKVEKELASIPVFEGNPGQLNQVFMNLFTNAVDAMNDNNNPETEKKLFVSTEVVEDSVKILVRDSGKGISDEDKEKIFDPFFTTKDVGKGTGLGLSISYGIIERHHGSIEVASANGNSGTEFTIILPFQKQGEKE